MISRSRQTQGYQRSLVLRIGGTMGAMLCILLGAACTQEQNPYTGRYQTAATDGTGTPTPGQSNNATPAGVVVNQEQAAQEVKTAAKTDDIPKAALTGVQVICSNPPVLAKYTTEMAVLCVNGQPTQAFANALKAAYKGGPNPPLNVIKSVDVNRVSEFLLLAVIDAPKPVAEVFAKRAQLVTGVVTATNAQVTQTVLANNPGTGGDNLGSMEVQFDLVVRVGGISVDNRSILAADLTALTADKSLIATVSNLKVGAPDNEDDILSTGLTFMMGDGPNSTKIISVNHQMANNRGRHPTAEAVALGLGASVMTDAYNKVIAP